MADYIKTKVSNLVVGDNIVWIGRIHSVTEKLGPASVKLREYKNPAQSTFKNRWRAIADDIEVDKVII